MAVKIASRVNASRHRCYRRIFQTAEPQEGEEFPDRLLVCLFVCFLRGIFLAYVYRSQCKTDSFQNQPHNRFYCFGRFLPLRITKLTALEERTAIANRPFIALFKKRDALGGSQTR